jgi:hypothetical protein
LLAEAFWMMEGYFVRTLGMHRVYNSAFMNMLKNEENQKYRQAIKNVMDFNPEIMKRYVNFMNNPDEETAVAQFGKDDKYFGVCTLMATLPGLPMFGHGQIEGFSEKYGMEYRRAYWDEQEDPHLISRHEHEIFPLLKKRYLFSQVQNFVLYDFTNSDGSVNEDVYAYSNRAGDERAFVVYNNKYDRSSGWTKHSCATAKKAGNQFVQVSLTAGLGLRDQDNYYTIFRDYISGMEFIRNNRDLAYKGLFTQLDGFKYHVFLDFRQIEDNEFHHYSQLNSYLNGRGVPNIDEALKETFLTPVHAPFRELLKDTFLRELDSLRDDNGPTPKVKGKLIEHFENNLNPFLQEIKKLSHASKDEIEIQNDLLKKFTHLLYTFNPEKIYKLPQAKGLEDIKKFLLKNVPASTTLYIWLIIHQLGRLQDEDYAEMISISWLDEFLLGKLIHQTLENVFENDQYASHTLLLIKALTIQPRWLETASESLPAAIDALFQNQETQRFLQVNRYQDVLYLNKESLWELLGAFFAVAFINLALDEKSDAKEVNTKLREWYKSLNKIINNAKDAGYRIEKMQQLLS